MVAPLAASMSWVSIGDSITAQVFSYPALLGDRQEARSGAPASFFVEGGSEFARWDYRGEDGLTAMFGANEAAANLPADTFEANIRSLVGSAIQRGYPRIMLISPTDGGDGDPSVFNGFIADYIVRLQAIAADTHRAEFLNINPLLVHPDDFADNIHPSEDAHRDIIAPQVSAQKAVASGTVSLLLEIP